MSLIRKYYVAKWDAITQQWGRLGTGSNALNANNGICKIIADDNNNIYAAGDFTYMDTSHHNLQYVAKWDAAAGTWMRLGDGMQGGISCLCIDDSGYVYAAGHFYDSHGFYYVCKWTGTNWQTLGNLNANLFINSICVDDSFNVYAAGNFSDFSGHQYVAKWNHFTGLWEKLGSGFFADSTDVDITSIFVDSIHNVFAAVNFIHLISGNYISNIFKWDGVSWSLLGLLNGNNGITNICKRDSGYIYATGGITDTTGNVYVAQWNPLTMQWGKVGSGDNAYFFHPYGTGIFTLCTDKNNRLYAGGSFTDSILPTYYNYVAEYGINNLAVTELKKTIQNIEIYPNPSKYEITINILGLNAKNSIMSYALYDLRGKIYSGGVMCNVDKRTKINIRELPEGYYFLQIYENDEEINIFKIIKNSY